MKPTRSTNVYYPMATTDSKSILEKDLYITDGTADLVKALDQFSIWEKHYGYNIVNAWIDIYDGYGHKSRIGRYNVKKEWTITGHIREGKDDQQRSV